MALWGNKDSKTASGTVTIASTGVVTGSSTAFTTEAKIGNIIKANGVEYQIVQIVSDTAARVIMGTNNGNGTITTQTAQAYALSEKPAFVPHESADSSGRSGNSSKVFGVNLTEAGVTANKNKGLTTPGWVRYSTYTDAQGNTRHKSEILVAGGAETGGTGDWSAANSGDAADDATLADA